MAAVLVGAGAKWGLQVSDFEHTRPAFEERCWQHYLSERAVRTMPGDVDDEHPVREQLFWKLPGTDTYGVKMFNAAWMAWCWALSDAIEGLNRTTRRLLAEDQVNYPKGGDRYNGLLDAVEYLGTGDIK